MVLDKTAWILIPHLIPFITFVEYSHYSHYADISHQGSENQSMLLKKVVLAQSCPTFWACQACLSMGFPSQEYWSGLPFPFPGDVPNAMIKLRSPEIQVDSSSTESPGKPVTQGP